MNFKPLLCNKVWKVYSHFSKTEKGGLVVAVQVRCAAFTLVLGFLLEKRPLPLQSSWLGSRQLEEGRMCDAA